MSSPDQKLQALVDELSILVANVTEGVRARGKESVHAAAFQPEAYPVSRETYEAIFNAVFAAGDRHGRMDQARRIVEYIKK